jgi:hypothetical protein
MEIAHFSTLTAEPATVIYIVTGTAGLLLTRLRTSGKWTGFPLFMLFCKKSTREKLRQISLT